MKKLMAIVGLLLVVALLVPVSCARASEEAQMSVPGRVVPGPEIMVEEERVPVAPEPPPAVITTKGLDVGQTWATERMIVRNGDMSLVVEDVADARDEIAQLAVRLDGYVVSSWISGEEEGMQGSISIRVPDEKFELTLAELRKVAVRVQSESTSSRDVTEEYVDLEARLKNAEATESQYLALLDRARDVEDMLKIHESLSRVRREVEQIKGRMQYLERTSSMSLITAQLRPEASDKPLVPVGWSALEATKSAIRGIVVFGQWLVVVVIWLLILLPIWGTAVGVVYWRLRRRKKKAQ